MSAVGSSKLKIGRARPRVPRRVLRSPERKSCTSASQTGDGPPATALRASMAHARCFVWVWPDAPSAASAKKLAKRVGSAGRNVDPTLPAYASQRSSVAA